MRQGGKMRIVLKISGHLLSPKPGHIDCKYISSLKDVLAQISEKTEKIVIVAGGGETARHYIHVGRKLGFTELQKDRIGIEVSRIHALILAYFIDNSLKYIPSSIDDLESHLPYAKIIVTGGFEPGQSTTTVAALCAEAIKANLLLLATTVDGVYTSDPKTDPNAKLLPRLHIEEAEKYIVQKISAGTYPLLDSFAIKLIKRSKIKTIVFNGNPPKNILRILAGEHIGTEIVFSD